MRTAALCASLVAGTANAQSTDFALVNDTGFTVYSVYIWPSSTTRQGSDLLSEDTLMSGNFVILSPVNDGDCSYNMRIIFQDSTREERWQNIDFCDISTVTLHYHSKGNVITATRD